ncbi:hypothetical protein C8Q70DRAFT_893532, partial [Cubamyces menziesii]
LRKSTLRGIHIPGLPDRLIAKLFADDTTAFLSEHDNYGELLNTIATWCRGSRAKFNEGKTEVIPIGTPAYRQRVLETHKLGDHSAAFTPGTHIVADGEPVRILGAWLGNKVTATASWDTIIALMRKNLNRWQLTRLTLHGKRLVINMEVGGRTQFLAKAQGMPAEIESKVQKLISEFIWGEGKHAMVSKEMLEKPVELGGLKVLDIKARNEAINMIWLKAYLNLTEQRP